jgi:hypothetical protein
LHVSPYRAEYRALIAAEGLALDVAPEVVEITCPRCGSVYVADLAPDEEPWDLEAREWQALVQLDGECPDHPHQFAVGEA